MEKPPRRNRRTKRGSLLRKNPKKRSTLIWRHQRQKKQLWQYRISLDASRRKKSRNGKPEREESVDKNAFHNVHNGKRINKEETGKSSVGGKLGVWKTNDSPLASTCWVD